MDNPAKGGRGKKAPYESTHYRLPVPLKPIAEEMAANYRELVTEYSDPEDPALIAAVISALAPGDNEVEENQQVKELLEDYQQMQTQIEELQQRVEKFKGVNQAIAILNHALTLKANAGGAIKEQIRQALELLL